MKSRIAGWISVLVASVFVLAVCSSTASAQGWVDRTGPGGPSPRWGHSMCNDPVRGYVLMVGGFPPCDPVSPFTDAWSWDGTQWTNRGIVPCAGGKLFWHAALGKMLLVGTLGSPQGAGFAWEWDGVNWVNQVQLPLLPDYYYVHCGPTGYLFWSVGYDHNRQEGVVVEGRKF